MRDVERDVALYPGRVVCIELMTAAWTLLQVAVLLLPPALMRDDVERDANIAAANLL